MSLVLENVIIRTACVVLSDFMSLVKPDQILSLFNQAYYYTNYCEFSVGKCYCKQGRKKQVKVGGLWLSGALFHKKGHLQVNSFTVAIQRYCL